MYEVSQREEMFSTLSDMHKDAYGFRNTSRYANYSDEELYTEMVYLQDMILENIETDKKNEDTAITNFEARITKMMQEHGISRATAIRWDMDAEDVSDTEHYLWTMGLPYTYDLKKD